MSCKSVIRKYIKNHRSNDGALIHCEIDRPRTGF